MNILVCTAVKLVTDAEEYCLNNRTSKKRMCDGLIEYSVGKTQIFTSY